jgi:hypothetical protein
MVDFAESLRESIPTVMRALAQASNSGILHVRGRDASAEFRFFRGDIVSARSSNSMPLGEALTARGAITGSDLQGVLSLQRRKKQRQPMATILVELGLIDQAVVETEIQIQVLGVLTDVLSWGSGEYSFEAKADTPGVDPKFTLPVSGKVDEILIGAGLPH